MTALAVDLGGLDRVSGDLHALPTLCMIEVQRQ